LIIAVDFDGTCVFHKYPRIGSDVPDAVPILRELVQVKHQLILLTMRGRNSWNPETGGDVLQEAVAWFENHRIPLFGVNSSPGQESWTSSSKVYAHRYVDDSAFGCPVRHFAEGRAVDWLVLRGIFVSEKVLPH